MEVYFTKHALKKKEILKDLGWDLDFDLVEQTVSKPEFVGKTKTGEKFALKTLDKNHRLRVVYKVEGAIIKVITFHVIKKGRYDEK